MSINEKTVNLCEEFLEAVQKSIDNNSAAIQMIDGMDLAFKDQVKEAATDMMAAALVYKDRTSDPEFVKAMASLVDIYAVMAVTGLGEAKTQSLIPAAMKSDRQVLDVIKKRAPNLAKLCA